jgi:hypothetical protein
MAILQLQKQSTAALSHTTTPHGTCSVHNTAAQLTPADTYGKRGSSTPWQGCSGVLVGPMDLAARHVDASLRSSCSAAVGPPASHQSVGMYRRAIQSVNSHNHICR